MPVSKRDADHRIARLIGVKEGDDKIEAANKAIKLAKLAGFPKKVIREFEALRDDAIRRGVR